MQETPQEELWKITRFSQLFKLHNEAKDYFESREKNTEQKDDFENHQSRSPQRLFVSGATVQRNAAGGETPLIRRKEAGQEGWNWTKEPQRKAAHCPTDLPSPAFSRGGNVIVFCSQINWLLQHLKDEHMQCSINVCGFCVWQVTSNWTVGRMGKMGSKQTAAWGQA